MNNNINSVAARAHTNIALIKYWGKRDEKLYLPTSTSLSLTLDSLYTDTRVSFDNDLDKDVLYINGELQDEKSTEKVVKVINLFRCRYVADDSPYIRVESYNHVPTAAGLASSSSGFAALSFALRALFENQYLPESDSIDLMNDTELSAFARQGSGSATRSIFGGFVEWVYGTGSSDSVAVPIDDGDWDVAMILAAVSTQRKKISSTYGMKHTAETSAFYPLWKQVSEEDLRVVREGIAERDIDKIGAAMEANCMKFHATMFAANPPFTYLTARSFEIIEYVHELRDSGLSVYFTMDAGPNVKILCRKSERQEIHDKIAQRFADITLFDAASGPAPHIMRDETWDELYG
ncbi:diphosphomevalonate decarboxylase [Alloscardovia theropitheci]|uniref:diphosphomevalonate decarboxylase n=1 Tax=Alloscardovia theropitheci TaxID=2496842 RepID=UPI001F0FAB03|nr:diphosphomevalonate decarboxylase [Alloscardovia theropitheci]